MKTAISIHERKRKLNEYLTQTSEQRIRGLKQTHGLHLLVCIAAGHIV